MALLQTNCSKDPFTVQEAIENGELDGKNYVQISKDAIILDDVELYDQIDSTSITLKGNMSNFDSINVGDIIAKLNYYGGEDISYYRRVLSKTSQGENTLLITAVSYTHLTLPTIYSV